MRKVENKIMLITYADSMGKNLKDLEKVVDKHFSKAIAGIHILPFFPSSGDRGFAPVCTDGYIFDLQVEVLFCKNCGTPIYSEEIEDDIAKQANEKI